MSAPQFSVTREEMRRELAGDLGRGGYTRGETGGRSAVASGRYFDKGLVLSRPGLVARAARLLVDMVPEDCERLATTDAATATLGSALAQETGLPMLLGARSTERSVVFEGEPFPRVKVLIIEDVVLTGERALSDVGGVRACGGDVLGVVCLLERERGGAQRLADAGVNLRALFHEADLLAWSKS